jgi:hypothetical protein
MPSNSKAKSKSSADKKTTAKKGVSKKKVYLVFISHATSDRWIARQISYLLEAKGRRCGVKTFLDERGIGVGDSIPETIRQNIENCNEFLVLLTRNSINRPWVMIEISAAWGQRKRIAAIIDKVTPEEMPEIILPYKAVDLNDLDDYIDQLLERARGSR